MSKEERVDPIPVGDNERIIEVKNLRDKVKRVKRDGPPLLDPFDEEMIAEEEERIARGESPIIEIRIIT